MKSIAIGYLCLVVPMSAFTFACYGWDKRQARLNRQRISEVRLHTLSLLGGWPGALIGRRVFRHKTQKAWFTFKTWAIVAIHALAIAGFLFLVSQR